VGFVASAGAVSAAGAVLVARTSSGQPLSESGDLLVSLLAVADAHLVFAREQFFSSSVLPPVFDWAIAAAGLREKEPAHAAFSLLSHLLAAASKIFAAAAADTPALSEQQAPVARAAAMLHQCIAAQGERLTRTLVLAACDTAPRQLLRAMSNVLYQLLQSPAVSEAGAAWFLKVLQEQQLPGELSEDMQPPACPVCAAPGHQYSYDLLAVRLHTAPACAVQRATPCCCPTAVPVLPVRCAMAKRRKTASHTLQPW